MGFKRRASSSVEEEAEKAVRRVNFIPSLVFGPKEFAKGNYQDRDDLLSSRKLILLVDLDQTLIDTSSSFFDYYGTGEDESLFRFNLYDGQHITKIRPYTKDFLEALSPLFEMHIVSFGLRHYVYMMTEMLDPSRTIFGSRILTREQLFYPQHKCNRLQKMFPYSQDFVVMLDDRADVWLNSPSVSPFRFWKSKNAGNGPSMMKEEKKEIVVDEDDPMTDMNDDDELVNAAKVLRNLHEAFFAHYDATGDVKEVKELLAKHREEAQQEVIPDDPFITSEDEEGRERA